jgi:glycerol-3-phosphate dehydrogenase subunit B
MRLQLALTDALARARGRLVIGPTVVGCEGAGGRITGVRVRDSARERTVAADAVVLATGGFAAGGIALDSRGALSERALGLPVAGPPEGAPPLSGRYLDHQPLMAAGVAVDDDGRPVDGGGAPVWANLYAAGAIVAGALSWREKSGEGIAIAGGHRAARRILEVS